ncbi:uncharacterized protein LOC119665688 [Teleopsis dalmanni]|uniref:uncharacterized protein LOC119665688 n=1 Tax=Teleopsis dalmanni TaxID=139649 RepID=UPI0018CF5F5A|nr:uncharacterized protein LOC119665688 [Teleopsis dalmanni]
MLENCSRLPNGCRYNTQLKTIALGVYFLSPLTYRHLRQSFNWPCERTLRNFVQSWPKSPGCTHSSIKALELRSRGFTYEQRFVSISCDEMFLRAHLQYDRHNDKIIGLEDFGDEDRTCKIASAVLTFMVQGIGGKNGPNLLHISL